MLLQEGAFSRLIGMMFRKELFSIMETTFFQNPD